MAAKRSIPVALDLSPGLADVLAQIARRRGRTLEDAIREILAAAVRRNRGAKRGQRRAQLDGVSLGRPALLTEDDRKTIRRLRNEGHTIRDLGARFGVSNATISRASHTGPAICQDCATKPPIKAQFQPTR